MAIILKSWASLLNGMKLSLIRFQKRLPQFGWLLAGLLFAGCSHLYYVDPNASTPFVFPGQNGAPGAAAQASLSPGPPMASLKPIAPSGSPGAPVSQPNTVSDILSVGDAITVSFSDIPPPGIQPVIQRIGNDGKISLPYNVKVVAAGKTVGQLQDDIRRAYVPSFFVDLSASVKSEERVFFVDGEVKLAGRLPYLGEMTVLRAISSAQGFTDFANRKKIEVRRATGQKKIMVNWYKAIEDPKQDLPVYPNDHIIVHRKVI